MEQAELQIVERYKQGELEAFGELYDLYVQSIYAFIVHRVSNRQTAEDLTSDVFMKALEAMPRFNPDRASFRTWIYQIARNRVIDYYRTHKQTIDLDAAMTVPAASDASGNLEAADNRALLQKLLGQLPEEHRELVIMRIWDELSYKEIAEITGQKEANLKVQFGRVIKKLSSLSPVIAMLLFTILD
jgi:RNA polymerase sigma-70 factor, ECF subfamily